ncbi:MAG: hypothetical protein WCY16_03615 [Weeksellaceae bacterium]
MPEDDKDIQRWIKKGNLIVGLGLGLFLLIFLFLLFIAKFYETQTIVKMIVSFFLLYLFWFSSSLFWKKNAFLNVRNVHRLKNKAILYKLIPSKDSYGEKLQNILLGKQWEDEIIKKFKTPDERINSNEIPEKVEIYFDKTGLKSSAFIHFVFAVILVLSSLYLGSIHPFGYAFLLIAVIFFIKAKKFYDKSIISTPIMTIDKEKILVKDKVYYLNQVESYSFLLKGKNRLLLNYGDEKIKIEIEDLKISPYKLDIILDHYLRIL